MKSSLRPRLLASVVLLALFGLGILLWYSIVGSVVPVYHVKSTHLKQTLVATGRVTSQVDAELGSMLTGRVAATPVEEGSPVKRGEVLLELEDAEIRANLALAEAGLAQADSTLAEAESLYIRQAELARKGFISAAALENELKQRNLARIARDAALAQRDATAARLSQYVIRAPSDGWLIRRDVNAGDLLNAGEAALGFASEGEREVRVDADERYLSNLEVGQSARIVADAWPHAPFEATVRRIGAQVDRNRGTVELRLKLKEVPEFLKDDMTVSADILIASKVEAMVLSLDCIRDLAVRPWVVRINAEGRMERVEVLLGGRNEQHIEILAGLKMGDAVVPSNIRFSPGQKVRTEAAPEPEVE